MGKLGCIRPVQNDDLEMMLLWRNYPDVRKNMYTRHEISLEEHLSWWERTKKRSDQKYFIFENKGKSCGVIGFVDIDTNNSNCSWAFYASPDAQKGTGSRMEYLALQFVFDELKLNKIYCEVLAFNRSVINLHEKFGFKVEGVFRQHHKFDMDFIDIYRLGLLSDEWSVIRTAIYNRLLRLEGVHNERK